MKKTATIIVMLLWIVVRGKAQTNLIKDNIDAAYLKHADVIVGKQKTETTLLSRNKLVIKEQIEVLVLNERGSNFGKIGINYNKRKKIKKVVVKYYNQAGQEIKKINKGKFTDESAISNFSLYDDNRALFYLNPPLDYPFTMHLEYEYETSNTLFIPSWKPIGHHRVAVLESSFILNNPSAFSLNKSTTNFDNYDIESEETDSKLSYTIKNIKAIAPEDFSPSINTYVPLLRVAPKKFTHEGIEGAFNSWKDVGNWIDQNLLKGQDALPQDAIEAIQQLTKGTNDEHEKIRLVYEYMQQKCRYISVQIGIGGWKPIAAEQVHRVGYGDCKALVNYTKALLKVAGIPSYYTIVYGSQRPQHIDKNFVSIQGNHAILCVPTKQDTLWLECTNPKAPAGFIGGFTDNRTVLTVFPDGGKIVRTKHYVDSLNIEKTSAKCRLDEAGKLDIEACIHNKGLQYKKSNSLLELKESELSSYYTNQLKLPGMKLTRCELSNNKQKQELVENLSIELPNYIKQIGTILTIQPNVLNRSSAIALNKSLQKEHEFQLTSSKNKSDIFDIELPENFVVDELPAAVNLQYTFAQYRVSIEKISDSSIRYTRTFSQTKGTYPKEEYYNFVQLHKAMKKNDRIRIILNQIKRN